ncbi:hypothetical protein M422DRAFT_227360 [Sphaerobolus stellatus SS14]|uniref:NUDE domain-containing protein n=1 Tax=Sphaerobolus stellatus (strain SS14) TaxID=990650 RepID=A0A0C9VSZ0_SPHS4|nr:hypothetical protein M422DRAFT_227360 [Sphaerobolus stellatus SS14]
MATVRSRNTLSPNDDPYETDWQQKYLDLQETLAETRQDLEEFQQSSKELEEEMNLELERTERSQRDLQSKVARLEVERDEWKGKFISLQTNHNTTSTSLQKEIDTLRQQLQNTKIQLRELEIGNDDLERNERAVTSSLADIETKYSRVLEEKILLEQELIDKASLEEQMQRLRDELRDGNEEISNLKRLLEQAQSAPATSSESGDAPTFPSLSPRPSLEDNILDTPPPNDLLLSDLGPEPQKELPSLPPLEDSNLSDTLKPRPPTGQSVLLSRAGFPTTSAPPTTQIPSSPSALPRPNNLGASRIATPKGLGRSVARPTASPSNLPTLTSKSKGVQMISALRSRVQTTQQRLIPGIPRLRLGSNASRTAPNPSVYTAVSASRSGSSIGQSSSRVTAPRKSVDSLSGDADRSSSPGWVLIQTQEDSPFPGNKSDEWRAPSPVSPTSSTASGHPPAPSSFKLMASTRTGSSAIPRRPPSRLSAGSENSPRPSTPTFLPVPVQHQSGPKRSTGGGPSSLASSVYYPRRSSLDTSKRTASPLPGSTAPNVPSKGLAKSTRERPTSFPVPPRTSTQPSSGRTSALGQSRIGKPSTSARKSAGGEADEALAELLAKDKGRLRAGSTSATRVFRP